MVELLIAAGADVNLATGRTALTPLHLAVNRGSPELVKVILGCEPQLELKNDKGFTPLQQTFLSDRVELARALLAAGANPNAACARDQGNRPLHWAARSGNAAAVELLLRYKADANALNDQSETPLSLVLRQIGPSRGRRGPESESAKYQRVVELLRQAGADESFHLRDTITVRRPNGQLAVVFRRAGSDVNRFTLLETVAMLYGVNANAQMTWPGGWDFPDFARAAILHRGEAGVRTIPVDLAAILASKDCSRDQVLEWGDAVELPEADHVVGESWAGLSSEAFETLSRCLTRTVSVSMKGETKSLTLAVTNGPSFNPQTGQWYANPRGLVFVPDKDAFWLKGAVDASRLVRTSSDLTRVVVKRIDPATGQLQTLTFNVGLPDSPQAGGAVLPAGEVVSPWAAQAMGSFESGGYSINLDVAGYGGGSEAAPAEHPEAKAQQSTTPLWLRDGDVIEISEKPAGGPTGGSTDSPSPSAGRARLAERAALIEDSDLANAARSASAPYHREPFMVPNA